MILVCFISEFFLNYSRFCSYRIGQFFSSSSTISSFLTLFFSLGFYYFVLYVLLSFRTFSICFSFLLFPPSRFYLRSTFSPLAFLLSTLMPSVIFPSLLGNIYPSPHFFFPVSQPITHFSISSIIIHSLLALLYLYYPTILLYSSLNIIISKIPDRNGFTALSSSLRPVAQQLYILITILK